MPMYEYWCGQCLKKFSELKSMRRRHRARCPDCGGFCQLVMSVVNHKNAVREEKE